MIEGLINIVAPAGQAQAPEDASDETLDNVALAGAEAIQRIINDRNTLRSCTTAQQRDLATLNSVNQELRRRLGLIRHHYVELATRILTFFAESMSSTPATEVNSIRMSPEHMSGETEVFSFASNCSSERPSGWDQLRSRLTASKAALKHAKLLPFGMITGSNRAALGLNRRKSNRLKKNVSMPENSFGVRPKALNTISCHSE